MTPEQITIGCAQSVSDIWPDLFAAGWRVRYPDLREEANEPDEFGVGPEATLSARTGVFKVVGTLVLVVALLAYLVAPFNTFMRAQAREQAPNRPRPIPVSPQHKSVRLGT
jgi:hypothetical protein